MDEEALPEFLTSRVWPSKKGLRLLPEVAPLLAAGFQRDSVWLEGPSGRQHLDLKKRYMVKACESPQKWWVDNFCPINCGCLYRPLETSCSLSASKRWLWQFSWSLQCSWCRISKLSVGVSFWHQRLGFDPKTAAGLLRVWSPQGSKMFMRDPKKALDINHHKSNWQNGNWLVLFFLAFVEQMMETYLTRIQHFLHVETCWNRSCVARLLICASDLHGRHLSQRPSNTMGFGCWCHQGMLKLAGVLGAVAAALLCSPWRCKCWTTSVADFWVSVLKKKT